MSSQPEPAPVDLRRAIGWGFALWAIATVIFAAAGDQFVPTPDSAALIPVIVAWVALVTGVLALVSVDYLRRTGLDGPTAGLTFGAVMAATGLILDGAMLVVAGLNFPGLDEERTRTVAAFMLLAYAVILIAPAATAAVMRRRGRLDAAASR